MDARSQYLASQAPRRKRTHPARSAQALNTSGAGIVHRQMMDLQRQPNLNKADTARLKDLRRDWNRNLKYTDAGMALAGASSPLDAQKYFRDTTEDFRQTNKPAYAKMYPLSSIAMKYGESGGLLGMLAKEAFGKAKKAQSGIQQSLKKNIGDPLRSIGSDIMGNIGIGGALDTDEEELKNYANLTYPSDVHPGSTPVIEGPMEQSEVIYSPHGPTYYDRAEGLDFDEDPNQPYVAPDDYVEDDFGAFYTDENTLAPERGLPFDDTNREQAIANQFATNFIGPRRDPSWRPDMYDVAGPGINRGLIPYPEYGPGIVYQEGRGRGDLPRYGYDYEGERKARRDAYKLQELLDWINSQKTEEAPPPLSIGASR